MKKFFGLFMLLLCLTGCASVDGAEVKEGNNAKNIEQEKQEETSGAGLSKGIAAKETDSPKQVNDYETEIILAIMSFNNESAEDYVRKLQEQNPDKNYSVYNEDYYRTTIMESARKEVLKELSDKETVEDMFSDYYSNESYGGAIQNIEYDDSFQNFVFYVDKDKYKANSFAISIGIKISVIGVSDTYQAYNLIAPEERITNIKFVDAETGDILN